jgi:hypothetical protein
MKTSIHRYDLGRKDLPIYLAEVIDHGDCSELLLPDGRRCKVRTRPASRGDLVRHERPGCVSYEEVATSETTKIATITFRLLDWTRNGKEVLQVLGYSLVGGAPPLRHDCPILDIEPA